MKINIRELIMDIKELIEILDKEMPASAWKVIELLKLSIKLLEEICDAENE